MLSRDDILGALLVVAVWAAALSLGPYLHGSLIGNARACGGSYSLPYDCRSAELLSR